MLAYKAEMLDEFNDMDSISKDPFGASDSEFDSYGGFYDDEDEEEDDEWFEDYVSSEPHDRTPEGSESLSKA